MDSLCSGDYTSLPTTNDSFFKEPMNEHEIRATASTLNLSIHFIYGELPHFSSTLVRRAPGTWKSLFSLNPL